MKLLGLIRHNMLLIAICQTKGALGIGTFPGSGLRPAILNIFFPKVIGSSDSQNGVTFAFPPQSACPRLPAK
jgi:hypothetical protein